MLLFICFGSNVLGHYERSFALRSTWKFQTWSCVDWFDYICGLCVLGEYIFARHSHTQTIKLRSSNFVFEVPRPHIIHNRI